MSSSAIELYNTVANIEFPSDFLGRGGFLYLSSDLAESIGVPHDRILATISERLSASGTPRSWYAANTINGEFQYVMTISGARLVLLSAGEYDLSAQVKVSIINQFNELESAITTRKTNKIKKSKDAPCTRLFRCCLRNGERDYAREINMVHQVVLGKSIDEIRAIVNISPNDDVDRYLDKGQLDWIKTFKSRDEMLIEDGLSFEERREELQKALKRVAPKDLNPWSYTPAVESNTESEEE